MRFHFSTYNHHVGVGNTLDDLMAVPVAQLRALGHEVSISRNDFVKGAAAFNILFEGFTAQTLEVLADAHKQGGKFIVIATEEPTEMGFNHGIDPAMVKRQEMFPQATPYICGILHTLAAEHVGKWYARYAPAAHMELGYAPSLVRFAHQIPTHEFGFFGGGIWQGSRRYKILQKLAKRTNHPNAVRVLTGYKATVEERDREMRDAKIILQLRLNEKMGLVSSSRCSTALYIGRAVMAEPHLMAWPWNEIVHFSPSLDAFYTEALAARGIWQGLHAGQFERFKRILTPERSIGDPLRKIGVLPMRVAA